MLRLTMSRTRSSFTLHRLWMGLLLCVLFFAASRNACAIEVKISPQALERTLRTQLFNSPEGRYYMRGDANSPCFVYADNPHVTFQQDRIIVHIHTRAKLGTSVHGSCIGITLNTDTDVSFIPEAQEESIGFRDARIERLSESRELNFLLVPFLSHKLPQQMKINAADLMRKLLADSAQQTGYAISLNNLKLHSMLVEGQTLVVDVDANMSVN
jgi:hypothetical protein